VAASIFAILVAALKALPILFGWLKDKQTRRDQLEEERLTPHGKRWEEKADLAEAIRDEDGPQLSALAHVGNSYRTRLSAQLAFEKAKRRNRT